MTCVCVLCGQLIHEGSTFHLSRGIGSLEEKAEQDARKFDLLAATLTAHMQKFHSEQSQQITAASWLASKVYAMRFASSSDEKFDTLKAAWQHAILAVLAPETIRAAAQDAAGKASSPAPASDAPSGS